MTHDIDTFWGSHSNVLAAALAELEPGAIVIEHGVGLYSSPLIARFDVRVIAIEEMPGWTGWARWLYSGRDLTVMDRAKAAIPRLASADLVFIDGAARERGDLLKWSLEAGAKRVIAHDTERDSRKLYGYASHLFDAPGYTATHDGNWPITTQWMKCS
jgi:hypothetical protein